MTREFFEAFGKNEVCWRVIKGWDWKYTGKYKTLTLDNLDDDIKKINILNKAFKKDIFFVVNEGGSTINEITRVSAQWADFDCGRVESGDRKGSYFGIEVVKAWKEDWWEQLKAWIDDGIIPEPSIIVETRNGFHIYFLYPVDNDYDLDNFTPIQESIIAKLDSDPKIKDLPRVMRVPNVLWQKYDEGIQPEMITVPQFCPEIRYTMDQLLKYFPVEAEWVKTSREKRESSLRYGVGGGLASAGTWYIQFTGEKDIIIVEGYKEAGQIHAACTTCSDPKGHDIVITPFSGGHRVFCNGDGSHSGGFASQNISDLYNHARKEAWVRILKAKDDRDFSSVNSGDILVIKDYLKFKNMEITPKQYIERSLDNVIQYTKEV